MRFRSAKAMEALPLARRGHSDHSTMLRHNLPPAVTHEVKQPLDISRPPAGVLVIDNFLDEAEISDALAQLERLEKERGDQQTATCPAKRQFLINVPAVADRLRSEIDASLGLVPIEATEGGAPKQEWLPARVMHGPTAEHRDEPQSAAPRAHNLDATKLDANKEAYRGGYIAIVYLGGDGALVLGSGRAAREVPVMPGRLVAWPNTDFVHSAHGHERRLLGPLAVVPGDRTAPLWLTVIASVTGRGARFIPVMLCAIVFWLIAQLTMGIMFLDDDSKCSSHAASFGLAIWNLTSFCWKAFIMAFFIIGQVLIDKFGLRVHRGTNAAAERKERLVSQVTFYLLVIHWVWIILGLVITVNLSGSHSSCPSGLYWFTVLSIAALYVNMSMMLVPVALKYTKRQALAIGGVSVAACAIVALALATEVPWFGVILVAASTFPTLVILGLVAIDVRSWWRAACPARPTNERTN